MKVAIIGAGASGLACGIVSARCGDLVDIYEKNSDAGKKLLLTGNGRCNYKSANNSLEFYHSTRSDLIPMIINEDNLNKMDLFFDSLGVISKKKNDCFYPITEKSSSIRSSLMAECKNLGVNFYFNQDINDISISNNGYLVNGKFYDKVVVASGSKAMPKSGSDGFSYTIGEKFNLKVIDVNPSLVQLISDKGICKELAGNRSHCKVSHYENGEFVKINEGEVQFTSYGLSGICIFNLSRDVRIGLNNGCKESVHIDFLPWLKEDTLSFFEARFESLPGRTVSEVCDGLVDYKIMNVLFSDWHIDKNKRFDELSQKDKEKFVREIRDYVFKIVDTKSFLEAQTCSGGIDLGEFNLNNMESLKYPNLHFIGEAIDLDGDCGGYNLTIAWITGILAGDNHA